MANKKNSWLRRKLGALSSGTERGVHRKIRGLGEKLGSPLTRGMRWYSKKAKEEKRDVSNTEQARRIYKERTGNVYPVRHIYTTPETRKIFSGILGELRKK